MGKKSRWFKNFIRDNKEDLKRYFPGPIVGNVKNNLSKNQVYPYGLNLTKVLNLDAKERLKKLNFSVESNLASIGTCFAEEISNHFKTNNDNIKYLCLEKNKFNFSANWGRVYTTKNLLQIVSYSLEKDSVPIHVEKYKNIFYDPLREYSVGRFDSKEAAFLGIKKHREFSRNVLKKSDLLIITLGQNEFWYDSEINLAWGFSPPLSVRKNQERFKPIEYTFNQNINDLNKIIKKLKDFNPRLKIIFTVSPVAEYATFLNHNIVSQAFAGKCILRAVLHEIVPKYEYVFYFPSFEYVLTDNPNSFVADNMHVKRFKVSQILKSLEDTIL
tara:strand:- start:15946 stop:16932 length:987 start_codon:yes stop_codon:yes gene_type:complete